MPWSIGISMKNNEIEPIGFIHDEMGRLAKLLNDNIQHNVCEEVIKGVLDKWVEEKVVRFHWSEKCDPDLALNDDDYRQELEGSILREIAPEINEMCGIGKTEVDENRHYVTLYIIAPQANF